MKKIVVFTGAYYPVPSANGVCLKRILEQIHSDDYEVHVVCHKQEYIENIGTDDGIFIHYIGLNRYHHLSVELNKNTGIKKALIKACLLFLKALYIFRYPLTSNYEINEYVKKYEEIARDESDCVAMAVFNPIDSVCALSKLKDGNRRIRTIGIYFDSLSNEGDIGILPSNIRNHLVLRLERQLFESNDLVILTESHKHHYSQSYYTGINERFRFIAEPLLDSKLNVWNDLDVLSNSFIYAGALSRERRNPQIPFEAILKFIPGSIINYFGYSDCEEIINNLSTEFDSRIKKKGRVPHEEVLENIKGAEYLISIGNKNSDMTPSKIYEYISTGKPIIHFYYDDRDACVRILKMYGNSICIKMNDDPTHMKSVLRDFCINHKKHLPYEQIKKTFVSSEPSYASDIILSWIEDHERK